ncbi:hypothetical protein F2Q70_00041202 [Brassica cretica]|uniref:Uncharacterized protein n=2 Tax=Brassica cretica TaxID=69181 RepID=A0A3N6RYW5_BRACR|nr:hypothetical protein F2Q70_00041202 [Brassica cretica]KAF2617791.1 hypothetical protein F2Q68_00041844 [Brassica cretica]KAF3492802.1 hypothetical protein DY000_02056755 [Brassica cretica]
MQSEIYNLSIRRSRNTGYLRLREPPIESAPFSFLAEPPKETSPFRRGVGDSRFRHQEKRKEKQKERKKEEMTRTAPPANLIVPRTR